MEGQSTDDVDDGLSTSEVFPRAERPTPRIMTTSMRKKRLVIVVGDSLLRGTEGPICWTDPLLGEVCCLPRKLPPSLGNFLAWYGPRTIAHYCSSMWVAMKLQHIVQGQSKKDFSTLGQLMRESGAQVTFSSGLPVAGSNIGRNRQTQSINTWLHGWCHRHNSGFFDYGMPYMAPGLLVLDGIHLFKGGRGSLLMS